MGWQINVFPKEKASCVSNWRKFERSINTKTEKKLQENLGSAFFQFPKRRPEDVHCLLSIWISIGQSVIRQPQCRVFNLGRGKSQNESESPWTLRARALIDAAISAGFWGVWNISSKQALKYNFNSEAENNYFVIFDVNILSSVIWESWYTHG